MPKRQRYATLAATLVLIASYVAVPLGAAAAQAASAEPAEGRVEARDRYIVITRDNADPSAVADSHRRSSSVVADRTFKRAVRGFSARLTAPQRAALARDPAVVAIVPDEVVSIAAQEQPAEQAVSIAAQTLPTGIGRVFATNSPIAQIDGVDTRVDADVAIVDTGIDRWHPDLAIAGGYNCTNPDPTAWGDNHWHGTHVAGTVGAIDNDIGVVGVAPGVRLWSVRILNASGEGLLSWYVCGLDWIAAQRDVATGLPLFEAVNMSVAKSGSDDQNCGNSNADILHQAICLLVGSGVTVVAAAANSSGSASLHVPAAYNEVITVSALADTDGIPGGVGGNACSDWGTFDRDDTFADFSNYGSDVDLIAPGKCIVSTRLGQTYTTSSGTSMAAPHVTGAVALYKSSRPLATPGEVKQALLYLGSTNWTVATDPDSFHEPLLDVSRIEPLGDYWLWMASGYGPVGELGGTLDVQFAVARTSSFFETIAFSVSATPGIGVALATPTLFGYSATIGTLRVTVPPATPAGTYQVTLTGSNQGRVQSVTTSVTVTSDAPTAPRPSFTLKSGPRLGATSVPMQLIWGAATDPSSAIAALELGIQTDGGAWAAGMSFAPSSRGTTWSLAPGHRYIAWLRARDAAGNWSPWQASAQIVLSAVQDSGAAMRYRGTWTRYRTTSAFGGTTRYATSRTASARVAVTGRTIAVIAPKGPSRGSFGLYVNGKFVKNVSLYASTASARNIVATLAYTSSAVRTIELRVLGTARHPRVDLDAVIVLR